MPVSLVSFGVLTKKQAFRTPCTLDHSAAIVSP